MQGEDRYQKGSSTGIAFLFRQFSIFMNSNGVQGGFQDGGTAHGIQDQKRPWLSTNIIGRLVLNPGG